MGEIKSTLDLVMEKTRHLSLTEEEKDRQREEEFEKRLQGLLQRCEDGFLSTDDFRGEVEALQKELHRGDKPSPVKAVLGRIDPDGSNDRRLDLLRLYAPGAVEPLLKILSEYSDKKAELIREGARHQLELLAKRGIQGTAVRPNLDREARLTERVAGLNREARERVQALPVSREL